MLGLTEIICINL